MPVPSETRPDGQLSFLYTVVVIMAREGGGCAAPAVAVVTWSRGTRSHGLHESPHQVDFARIGWDAQ